MRVYEGGNEMQAVREYWGSRDRILISNVNEIVSAGRTKLCTELCTTL